MIFLLLLVPAAVAGQFFQDQFFGMDSNRESQLASNQQRMAMQMAALEKRVLKLEKQVVGLQMKAHSDWNQTDSGSMYKLFEQRKNWDEAESFCQSLDSHLAVVDNEVKNKFINSLILESKTADFVWIGMKTKTSTTADRDAFSNFAADSPIDGCAVMDVKGAWSIRSCSQLRPFVCHMLIA